MTEFLLFTLHAPLTSWGEIAVGEMRGSWDRPSRSAVLGLVAAALGLTRDAQADHDALDSGYGVAVRLDAPGAPMVDYHTAQTVAENVARRLGPTTRARLLVAGEPRTILSRRWYRQDTVATVALWAKDGARWPLAELADALGNPTFTLYAGRKANALGLPLAPEVAAAATMAEAFLRREETRGIRSDAPTAVRESLGRVWVALRPRDGWGREVSHDADGEIVTGLVPHRREVRRDAAPHRARWHYAERVVEVGLLPVNGPAAEASL